MIGPLELVQNYEKAAREFMAGGRNEQAKKELKKAISAIIDQQDNFDPDEFKGLVKTIENIFDDYIKIDDYMDAYDAIILLNAFDSDKQEVAQSFKKWVEKSPGDVIEQLRPRILKFTEKNKLYKQIWDSYSGGKVQTQINQTPVQQPSRQEGAKPQISDSTKSKIEKPTEPEVKQMAQETASAVPKSQLENVNKLKLTLATTEITRGNLDNAYTLLNDILKTDPNNKEAKDLLSQVEERKKKMEEEKVVNNLIKECEPSSPDEEEILKKFFSRNWKEANDSVTRAIAKDRNNARLWAMKSIILKKLGDDKASLNFESYSKKLDPNIQNSKMFKTMNSFN